MNIHVDQVSSGKASVLIEVAEMQKELISLESKISSKKLLLDKYICKINKSSFSSVRKSSDVRTVTERYNKYCEPMLTDICFLKTEINILKPKNGNVQWKKKKNWKKKY